MDRLPKLFGLDSRTLNTLVKATDVDRYELEGEARQDGSGWAGPDHTVLLALKEQVTLRGHVISSGDGGVWISTWHSVYQFEGPHRGRVLFVPFEQIVLAEAVPAPAHKEAQADG